MAPGSAAFGARSESAPSTGRTGEVLGRPSHTLAGLSLAIASAACAGQVPSSTPLAPPSPGPSRPPAGLARTVEDRVKPQVVPRLTFTARRHVAAYPVHVASLPRWVDEPVPAPMGRRLAREHLLPTPELETRPDAWLGETDGLGLTSSYYAWGILRSGPHFRFLRAARAGVAKRLPGLDVTVLEPDAQILWEGVRHDPEAGEGSRWQYAQSVGIYDRESRTVSKQWSRAIDLEPLVDDRLFAFIRCASASCIPWELELVAPAADVVAQNGRGRREIDGTVRLSVERGSSNTYVLFSSDEREPPITIEAQQAVSEAEPTVTVQR